MSGIRALSESIMIAIRASSSRVRCSARAGVPAEQDGLAQRAFGPGEGGVVDRLVRLGLHPVRLRSVAGGRPVVSRSTRVVGTVIVLRFGVAPAASANASSAACRPSCSTGCAMVVSPKTDAIA